MGNKHHLRKFADRKAQNQEGVRSAHRTDLCFSICRFSQVVFIPQAQPRAQSLFLFPIVFGINFLTGELDNLLQLNSGILAISKDNEAKSWCSSFFSSAIRFSKGCSKCNRDRNVIGNTVLLYQCVVAGESHLTVQHLQMTSIHFIHYFLSG